MLVDNLKLLAKFRALSDAAKREGVAPSVVIGYTGKVALWVHEMTPKHPGKPRPSGKGVFWGPSLYGNQYLLGPARQFAAEVAGIIRRTYAKTGLLLDSLYLGGLRIRRESRQRVPAEYKDLWRSAFVEKEK